MSEKENKEKTETKEPEETSIAPRYPGDVFEAFDDMLEGFRREFLTPWRVRGFWGGPLRRRGPFPLSREPFADLVDLGDAYEVRADVPGIPKDKIDLSITKDGIEISGKAETRKKEEDKGYVIRERSYAEIHRRIAFPEEVVPEKAKASLADGVLEIRVPKKTPTPEVKKHKVEIK